MTTDNPKGGKKKKNTSELVCSHWGRMLTSTALFVWIFTKMQSVNDKDGKVCKAECCDSGVKN